MKMMNKKIVIGKTRNKAIVSICEKCEAYHIPHFNYEKGKKHYSIEFEKAQPLDHGNIMEMEERTDLEEFFASYNKEYDMTNWQLAVKTWNENNEVKISNNLHKPYYRNMTEEVDDYVVSTWNNRSGLPNGMQIYCNEEVETEPHFHITLEDGIDIAIYFDKAEYLEPLARKLTNEEIDILVKYLDSECEGEYFGGRFEGYKNWHLLIFAWNNENAHTQSYIFPEKRRLNEKLPMPDYFKLNKKSIEGYGFTDEIISEIYNYCSKIENVDDEYMLSVAKSWHENNIKTKQDLDNYLKKQSRLADIEKRINALIKRKVTEYERYYIEKWYFDYGYSLKIIELVINFETLKGKVKFDYIDRVFNELKDKGIKTLEQVRDFLKI